MYSVFPCTPHIVDRSCRGLGRLSRLLEHFVGHRLANECRGSRLHQQRCGGHRTEGDTGANEGVFRLIEDD
jgi:hypothetical protein